MKTTISSRGNVHVPRDIREKLGITPGDELEIYAKAGCIVVRPIPKKVYKTYMEMDPVLGHPVLRAEEGAPVITSEMVGEMLEGLP